MTRASNYLSISQPAISKRIANLEAALGKKVIERKGRRVELTAFGERLLQRARPLMNELREALEEEVFKTQGKLKLAVSGMLLPAGAGHALTRFAAKYGDVDLELQVHCARIAIELAQSGACTVALCPGSAEHAPSMAAEHLGSEPFVVVPSGLRRFKFPQTGTLKAFTIDSHAETFSFIERSLRRSQKNWGIKVELEQPLQNYYAIVELAKSGYGHGIAPLSVAKALGVPTNKLVFFPEPGMSVPISLIGRKSILASPLIQTLREHLESWLERR
jgi:DNA-binding transcriptional LysR family regulator